MKKQTIAINTPYVRPDAYGSLAVPIYNNVAFEFQDAQEMADAFCNRIKAPDYARVENPTVTNLEQRVKALTGATHVTAFNSGMAAISNTLLAVAAQGTNIITSHHLFGNTLALITKTLQRYGVESRLLDLTDLKTVSEAIDGNTCCVYLEVLTNPQLEVADLKALAAMSATRPPSAASLSAPPRRPLTSLALSAPMPLCPTTLYVAASTLGSRPMS